MKEKKSSFVRELIVKMQYSNFHVSFVTRESGITLRNLYFFDSRIFYIPFFSHLFLSSLTLYATECALNDSVAVVLHEVDDFFSAFISFFFSLLLLSYFYVSHFFFFNDNIRI
jgi:hypothetical protein